MKLRFLNKLILVSLLIVCGAGALAVGMNAQASAPTTPDAAAPAWLQSQTALTLNRFAGEKTPIEAVDSIEWVKSTWGQYEAAVGGGSDESNGNAVYVVIAHGDFSSANSGSETVDESPISGTVLVITYDGSTEKLSTIDLLYTDKSINEGVLGEMSAMTSAN